MRALADDAFSRAAAARLISGNRIRLLRDGRENYPAWLKAIGTARRHIHFESYIIHEDSIRREFADALIARAREGVRVRVVYDWMGGLGTSRRFWNNLRAAGVEVRCYNPPRLDSPLGWLSGITARAWLSMERWALSRGCAWEARGLGIALRI